MSRRTPIVCPVGRRRQIRGTPRNFHSRAQFRIAIRPVAAAVGPVAMRESVAAVGARPTIGAVATGGATRSLAALRSLVTRWPGFAGRTVDARFRRHLLGARGFYGARGL